MPYIQSTRRAAVFVAITYAISYLAVFLYLHFGGIWNSLPTAVLIVLYMFIPMTVTLILRKGIYKEGVVGPLGISFRLNRWFLAAWLFPVLLALATLGVSLLLPGVRFDWAMTAMYEKLGEQLSPEKVAALRYTIGNLPLHPFWLSLFAGMVAGITVNAIAAFGEELGWRGFLQRELGFLGFWRMSLVIGIVWGFWHLPIILQGYNYPQHPVLGVSVMTIFTVLLSPIFSYVRLKSGSVIATSILHGTLNGVAGIAVLVIRGGNDLTVGVMGIAGLIVLALVDIALFVFVPKLRQRTSGGDLDNQLSNSDNNDT